MLNTLRFNVNSVYRSLYWLFILLCFLFKPAPAFADGSKDLYPSGATGNRAFLYCNTNTSWTDTWPFKTTGTHFVYAKAGEVIAAASSAQGYDSGTIIITSPNGTTYNSGSSTTVGRITNRTAELAGPDNGAAGSNDRYTPFERLADVEGIWRVDFIPPIGEAGTASFQAPDISATANWTQGRSTNALTADVIAAWDVSVRNGTTWLPGRVYTNVLNLVIKDEFTSAKSYYAIHYVLTKDGRAYRIQTNGNNGVGFTFFSNSNGFAVNSIPTYKSLNFSTKDDISAYTHDPRSADNGNNVTHKIFYTKPAPDLPSSSSIYMSGATSSTWLKNTAVLPKINNLVVVGKEGTIGQASTKGAYINFESTTGGTYKITIPVPSGTDRVIVGVAAVGSNSVFWDGKDGSGNFVPAGTTISQLKTRLLSAEVHFPYIDMEINPKGLIIELTDNTTSYNLQTASTDEGIYSNKVYWDDSDISGAGSVTESSNPPQNLSGLSSIANGHKWGTYSSSNGSGNSGTGGYSFGNNKSMDTWAYIQGSEESQPIALEIKTADLMVESIIPTVNTYFTNQQVSYKIRVKNNGPSNVLKSTFDFKAPAGFVVNTVISSVISGTAVVNTPITSGSTYTSKLDMNNQAVIEFTITGTVGVPLLNLPFDVEASIMRPSDVTDPDATNPDPNSTPLDPHTECLNGTVSESCNNIKYNTFNPQQLCLTSPIATVSYIVASGFPDVEGYMPLGLVSNYANATKILDVSGTPTESGLFNFTLISPSNSRKKTTVLLLINPNPVINTQPLDITVCEGSNTFASVVSSASSDTYKWQYESSGNWIDFTAANGVSDFTTSKLIFSNIPLNLNGTKIRVVVTSAAGCSTTSTVKTITVNPLPATPVISTTTATTFCAGGSVILTSNAATGNQWYKDGIAITNATSSTYTATSSGKYTVIVTDGNTCSSPVSNDIDVLVNPLPPAPVVTVTTATTFCAGGSVVLTSNAASGNQWYKDGVSIAGAVNPTYTATTSGKYTIIVTDANTCSSPVSNDIDVLVNPLPPAPVITVTTATTFCAGGSVILTSNTAAGNQWYKDGIAISSATNATYTATTSGKYTVIVTDGNTCSSPVSNDIDVVVNPLPPAPVVTVTTATTFCAGGSVVLTSNAATGNQWYKDGIAITNATSSTYTATTSGKYTVIVTDGNTCSSPVSNDIDVIVNPLPPAPVVAVTTATTFCAGGSVILTSNAASGNQWYKDGLIITGAVNRTYTATASGKYTVIVTDGNICSSPVSNDIDVVVNPLPPAPVISTTTATTFCAGGSVILTSNTAAGNQWYKDGVIIAGAVNPTYTATASGKYTVVVTDGNTCSSPVSNDIDVVVNPLPPAPVVTVTTAITFCAGGSVILTSNAAAGNQWYKDGVIIAGAVNPTYTATTSGKYTVIVTDANTCSSPVSNDIDVVVNPLPPAPVVTVTTAITFCAGGSVILTSNAAAGNQWYKDGVIIAGAVHPTYTATSSGKYTVIVTDGNICSSPVSNDIDVVVNPLPPAPVISTTTATTFCAGGSVVLTSSAASGNQWYKDGIAISSATSSTYTATTSGKYTVIVTDGNTCSSPVSNDIDVVVNPLPPAPVISTTTATTLCAGGSVVLTSSSATGNQWYKDGVIIAGAVNPTYTATATGKYTVIVTDGNICSSPVSNDIDVLVNPLPPAPVITVTTVTTFCAGGSVILTSNAATGNQWYKDGVTIAGAVHPTYTATASGKYTVIVTDANTCSSSVSNDIDVLVNPLPPAPVVSVTTATTFCAGGSVILTSNAATGNQWYKDGIAIANATSSTYTATTSGAYTVIVTDGNTCSSPVSNGIDVLVNPLPPAPVISTTTATIFCAGGSVILTSNTAAGNQWYKDGVIIAGAVNPTYTATASGKYTVIVTDANTCSSPVSNDIDVVVNPLPPAPVVTVTTATTFCAGSSVILTSNAATGNQWYKDGIVISGAVNTTYTATATGKYTVIVTDGNICSSPVSNDIDVVVNPLPPAPVISTTTATTFCAGGSVILTSNAAAGNQWYKDGIAISSAINATYTATTSGKYTVIVTDGNTCSSPVSNDIDVVVNPLPPAPVISTTTATTFCAGGSVVLTSNAATGNQWYKDGIAMSSATSPTYTATATGKYTVIVTDGNTCSSPVSNDIDVLVNPLPPAPVVTVTTATTFCAGGSVILTSNAAAGNQWYKDGIAISSATNAIYTATSSGEYTVIVTDANTCSSPVSNDIDVVVNPLPPAPVVTVTTATTFCAGGSVILTSNTAAGNQWYKDGVIIAGAVNPTYTATASGKYMVIVTDANTCSSPVSNDIDVVVNPLPPAPVVNVTTATTFCAGGSIILTSSAATGNQWYKDGVTIAGAVHPTYTATASGKYTVIVTDANTCSSPVSNGIDVLVNPLLPAPVISTTTATTLCAGGSVVLTSSSATGNQWYKDGVIIAGAVNPTYTATASGKYTVIVTDANTCSSPVSNDIDVLVNPLPPAPVVTVATATTFCAGGSVILTSNAATGNQWYKDGIVISGAVNTTYTATATGKYTVIVTDGNICSSPVSNDIDVVVNPLPPAPVISITTATTFCAGGSVALTSSSATGNQWYKDGIAITNATSSTYTATSSGKYTVIVTDGNTCSSPVSNDIDVVANPLPPAPVVTVATATTFCAGGSVILTSNAATGNQWYKDGIAITNATSLIYTATASGKYTVIVTDGNTCSSPVSNDIDVVVNPLPARPIVSITTTTTFCAGGSVVLTSNAASGNQWYKDGIAIANATSSTYTATTSGKYTVIVTNGNACSSPASNDIDVVVNPLPPASVISTTTATTFCAGGSVILTSSAATGNQWYKDGIVISGAVNPTYTATSSGKYTVIVTNGNTCSSPVSNHIDVVVNPLPPVPVVTVTTATTFCASGSVILTSNAAAGNQWYKDGVIIAGAVHPTYTATSSGKYTVIVTDGNTCSSPVSNDIDVVVNPLPPAPVISTTTATTFCAGGSVVLTSNAATGNQWYKDGITITNATSSTYTATTSGKYTVIVTDGNTCSSPVSNDIDVIVNPLPPAPVVAVTTATTFCAGGSVILTSNAASGNQWYKDGLIITGAVNQTYTATTSGKYTIIVTDGNTCSSPVSNGIDVLVNPLPPAPVISTMTATTFCAGGSVVLTSNAASGNQWYKDGIAISSATNATYTATTSGKYTVIVTDANACSSPVSNDIDVVVNPLPPAPVISTTTATIFCAGGSVILTSSAATGNQWYKDGIAISSATSSTYTATTNGKYTVIVTDANTCSSPVSNDIDVVVNPLPPAPVVTVTTATTFCAGGSVILTSNAATGNQWYKDGIAITNATNSTYIATTSGKYTVIITDGNTCSSPVSNNIDVLVNPLPARPIVSITTTTTFCAGGSVVLTSNAASGNQWYKDGIAISSATSPTYTATSSGKYAVIVTDGNTCASPVSNDIDVTVNPLPARPTVSITTTTTFCAGGSVVLTSNAATGNQWYKDGIAITNATSSTYTATSSGKYTIIVTDGNTCSSPVSNDIDVVVNPLPPAPVISTTTATTFCAGGSVVLTSNAATSNQWYKDGIAITNATSSTYTARASGKYTVIVTDGNTCASPVSNDIDVTVNPLPARPTVSITTTTTFCAGGSVVLTSNAATGNQWYKDGIAITNATSSTYTATSSGAYTVIVTDGNTCSSPVSNNIDVLVNPLPPTPVVSATTATTFCGGSSVVLTSSAAAGNQWYKDGIAIANATNATYTATTSGKYTIILTNGNACSSPVSNDIDVLVNPLPPAPVISTTTATTFCAGGSVILTSNAATGNQWYKNGIAITNATSSTYTATASGKYTVILTDGNTCSSPVSNTIDVTVNLLPQIPSIIVTTNTTFCVGNSVVLTSGSTSGNQWYKDGQMIQGATQRTYTAASSGNYTVMVTNVNGCQSSMSQAVAVKVVLFPVTPSISPAGAVTFCEGGIVTLTSSSAEGNQWYKNGSLIPGATGQTIDVNQIGNYTIKVTNATGCASPMSALTNVTVNRVPKGYNDLVNTLSCTQSSFSYDLQFNVNNTAKGGNAVPSFFTWTASSTLVRGVTSGAGKTINAILINTSPTEQNVIYTVTPRAETGGCSGQAFLVTVRVPACIDISISKTADRSSVAAPGDKVNYTITVYNNGNANHNQVKVNDPLLGGLLNRAGGDNGNGILEKGETWTYNGTYSITQTDLDNNGIPSVGIGKIINTATVSSLEFPGSKSAIAEVTLQTNPSITLVKTGAMNRDFRTMTYTFKITNNGNVTLNNLVVRDPKILQPIVLKQTVLAPGASTSGLAVYTITNEEKIAGSVSNTARAEGLTKTGAKAADVSGTEESNDDPTVIDITRYPIAIDDFANTKADEEVMVPVINNDRPALFPLNAATLQVKSQPSHGVLMLNKDGKVVYKPNRGFFGIEKFSYKVDDANGLSSNIAQVTIDVAPPPLDVPNTFTPNGDGKNDNFQITGMENYDAVSIFVYNRWGDEVYRSNNYKNEWNGNGLNEGTYFYVLKLKKGSTEESRRSWVLIKR